MSKFVGELVCSLDAENIYAIFKPELESEFNNRAGFDIIKKDNKVYFKIFAEDVTALKAVMNSILRVLKIYEDTKEMLENELNPRNDLSNRTDSPKSPRTKTSN